MTLAQPVGAASRKPIRLWPGIVAAVLAVLVVLFLPVVAPSRGAFAILGGVAGALLILLWWLFSSRAPWADRLLAVVLIAVAIVASKPFADESLASGMFYVVGVPIFCLALVVWAAGTRPLGSRRRRAWLFATMALASLALVSVRVDGVSWTTGLDFAWRWSPTAEERLLAQLRSEPVPPANSSAAASSSAPPLTPQREPEWPGFRGLHRDGIVRGVSIETDWSKSPPEELWRRPVGPGWSSFAVADDRAYTQEQLGEVETVSCYDLATGEPVWRHGDSVRFWEATGGAGPRATPTLHDGRVYTFGGSGILNALDARDGSVVWSRNVATDAQKSVPIWGFAGSPLVVGDAVVVAADGKPVSYDLATGDLRWVGPEGAGYSSPQISTIDGVEQILILNGLGVVSVEAREGKELWKYEWPGNGIVQPAVTDDGDVLIGGDGSGMGGGEAGIRRVDVSHASGDAWSPERGTRGWTVEERWTSTGLKPFFNDFVLHHGHAYGFDGAILACIGLDDGARKWKGGRYGNGQLVLLADQDLLLVLSEKGELALVDASPDQFTERARFKAIDGKTWNHPVLVGDVVLVRNGEEMAAFRVELAGV
jgi:outer membrane protein assembly factor BamB